MVKHIKNSSTKHHGKTNTMNKVLHISLLDGSIYHWAAGNNINSLFDLHFLFVCQRWRQGKLQKLFAMRPKKKRTKNGIVFRFHVSRVVWLKIRINIKWRMITDLSKVPKQIFLTLHKYCQRIYSLSFFMMIWILEPIALSTSSKGSRVLAGTGAAPLILIWNQETFVSFLMLRRDLIIQIFIILLSLT